MELKLNIHNNLTYIGTIFESVQYRFRVQQQLFVCIYSVLHNHYTEHYSNTLNC